MKKKNLPLRGLLPLDSGGIYLLASITKYMLQSLVILIMGFFVYGGVDINDNLAVSFSLLFMTQAIYILTPLIYGHFTGISYMRELNFKRGVSPVQAIVLVAIALFSIAAFMPISSLFIELMQLAGYKYEVAIPSYYDNVGILILALIFIAIMPAIGEEIMYRGFVARGFRKFGIIGAFFISSLLFATAHGNLLQLVYQFFLGLVLVTVYLATRSIYASMIVHLTNNAAALIINYVTYKITGSDVIVMPLEGAARVFATIGISIAGMVVLCLLMWLFIRICKKRQDAYVGERTVDLESTRIYGKYNKKGTNFITKYFDLLKYLNYSFEDDELDRTYKIKEQIDLENAKNDKEKGYAKELLDARLEKDRRWDRNMMLLAIAFNVFLLLINIINAFRG